MSDDAKWGVLAMLVLFMIPLLGIGFSQYQQHQCRIAGIEKQMPVDEIIKLCKESK